PHRHFGRAHPNPRPVRRAPRMFRVTAVIRLRAPSPFGAPSRHSPGCYLWLSFGLRLPGSCSSLRHRKPLLLASSSRPGRCAGEAGSEAARAQGYEPRTQAPHPTPLQGSSREAPPPNANHPAERDEDLYLYVGILSIRNLRLTLKIVGARRRGETRRSRGYPFWMCRQTGHATRCGASQTANGVVLEHPHIVEVEPISLNRTPRA